MTLADCVIQSIASALIVLTGLLLDIRTISENAILFFIVLISFGFALIPLVNLFAQTFDTVEAAFKSTTTLVLTYYVVGIIADISESSKPRDDELSAWPKQFFTFQTFGLAILLPPPFLWPWPLCTPSPSYCS